MTGTQKIRDDAAIRIDVDCANPGQFFACCGLFELAHRLWPGAEAWFVNDLFCIACPGALGDLLAVLSVAEIHSSLTDNELKRLATLLSAEKATLSAGDAAEKGRLQELWRRETLYLGKPFGLLLDWWLDEQGGTARMKTWAAKQLVLEIARGLKTGVQGTSLQEPLRDILRRASKIESLPFYFDSETNSQKTARDTGFGAYDLRHVLKTGESIKPTLEFCAFLGIQRFRPQAVAQKKAFRFTAWNIPLPISVAATATAGLLNLPGQRTFVFPMLYRSQYMKAFLPATIFRGKL